jgi:DNA-binding transcriptional ArsR family regulator
VLRGSLALAVIVSLAAPVLADAHGEPAQVEAPIEAEGVTLEADQGSVLLHDGNASLAASAATGSLVVWEQQTPCVEEDESTCFEGRSETSRTTHRLDGASLSWTPRDGSSHETFLASEDEGRFALDADETPVRVRGEAHTVELTDAQAPDDVNTAEMPAGPVTFAPQAEVLLEGSLVVKTVGSTLLVDANASEEPRPIETGTSWEEGDDGFHYRTLRLAMTTFEGGATTSWDDRVTATPAMPSTIRADRATVNVTEGQLGEAAAGDGPTELTDLEAAITAVETREQAIEGEEWQRERQQAETEQQGYFVVDPQAQPAPAPEDPDEASVSRTTLIGAGSAAAAAVVLAAYYWPRLSWLGTVAVMPFYSRIEKDELFENETREELYEHIEGDPGVHANALSEAVDIGWGTTVYHLRRLERNGFVHSEKRGRYRRFFPASGFVERQREALSVLQNETTEAIAELVREQPGLNQSAICEELDISPSLANWHLNRLIDAELVDRERRGRTVHYTPGEAWEALEQAAELGAPEAPSDAQPA